MNWDKKPTQLDTLIELKTPMSARSRAGRAGGKGAASAAAAATAVGNRLVPTTKGCRLAPIGHRKWAKCRSPKGLVHAFLG